MRSVKLVMKRVIIGPVWHLNYQLSDYVVRVLWLIVWANIWKFLWQRAYLG